MPTAPEELEVAERDVAEGEELVRSQAAVANGLPPGQAKDDALALLASLEEGLRAQRDRLAKLQNSN